MRIRVVLVAPRAVTLPWNYQHYLMGMLYKRLISAGPELERHFHEEGVSLGPKRYRFFTFSRLFPRTAQATKTGLMMEPPIELYVSSPLPHLMDAFVRTVLPDPVVRIGPATLELAHAYVVPEPPLKNECLLETLSPLVASEGVKQDDGRLWKRFLSPDEPKFWTNIATNIRNKARALGLSVEDEPIEFEPQGPWRSRLVEIQGSKVRAFDGRFVVRGSEQLLRLGYQAGFGERNSQGFGMVQVPGARPSKRASRRATRRARRSFRPM